MLRTRALFASFLMLLSFASGAAATLQLPRVQMPDFKGLERELRLKPAQKEQFDVAVGSLKRTLLASSGIFMELKQQLADELMKSQPDFPRLLRSQRAAFEMMSPLLQETLDEWARLYALLEDDQVLIAKRFLRDNLPRWPLS
jgi:hypothetical protein